MRGGSTLFDDCMAQIRGQMLPLGLFSLAANLLLLVSSIYMLQVFDRVLSSGSVDTLLWLTVAAVLAIAVYGVLELARRRLLSRAAAWLDAELAGPVIRRGVEVRLAGARSEAGSPTFRRCARSWPATPCWPSSMRLGCRSSSP